MTDQAMKTKRNLKPFWILLAISGLPYLLSWIWYANMETLPEVAANNRGELIEPVRPLGDLTLTTVAGDLLDTNTLKGNWTLMMAGSSDCDETCMKNVYFMRQVRRLMGEEREKIKRIFVMTDNSRLDSFKEKISEYGKMEIVSTDAEQGNTLIEQMTINNNNPENRIFIVDPLANLMMAYPQDVDPEDIAKDFRRLLKVVRIGDPKEAG